MNIKTIFVVAILVASFSAYSVPLIIGGEAVKDLKSHPFIVSILTFKDKCGGTIISDRFVLTAAHCVDLFDMYEQGLLPSAPPLPQITAGSLKFNDEGGLKLKARKVHIHPKYTGFNRNVPDYDFALIELDQPINFKATSLSPAKLPTLAEEQEALASKNQLEVLGWGLTAEWFSEMEESLLKAKVNLSNIDEAKKEEHEIWGNPVNTVTMVASVIKDENGPHFCYGDSGGPLYLPDGSYTLIGVVSWTFSCHKPGRYQFYARVSSVTDWIKSITQISLPE